MSTLPERRQQFFFACIGEHQHAGLQHKPINSLHESYAVLLEEVDELWDEVRKKPSQRDPRAVLAELYQIAAMAGRIATDVVMPQIEGREEKS